MHVVKKEKEFVDNN